MQRSEQAVNADTRKAPESFDHALADQVARELRKAVQGEVHFDDGTRALYATDGSLYRHVPIGVVFPRRSEDVRRAVAICHRHQVPVLSRGAGTSLAGQTCNVAVILDFSRHLDQLISLDPQTRLARVQPGCVLDYLRSRAEEHHLTFGPDPSTHTHNTLGGMLGNNSCGVHSVMAGRTADNVRSLRVLTYDGAEFRVGPTSEQELDDIIAEGGRRGEIYAGLKRLRDRYAALVREGYPDIPRRVSGYNLDELLEDKGFNVARALVGSEGTCVVILEAELELVPSPQSRCVVMLGYPDVYTSCDHITDILSFGPVGLEGMDHLLIREMRNKHMHPQARSMLPDGNSWLLVEFGGDTEQEATDKAHALMRHLGAADSAPTMALFVGEAEQKEIWNTRDASLGATSRSPALGDTFPGWEDAAVAPENVGAYLRDFRQLMHRFGYEASLYGHFGNGCIHCRINFSLANEAEKAKWRAFMEEAAELVVHYGGSLSGEHGDGQVRAELLPRMYGPELMDAMREFKTLWDPQGKMNPGKLVDPYSMTASLRFGPGMAAPRTDTYFAYTDDDNSFFRATNRCVGIGNCRRKSGGVMCPSFRATDEEQHSTRGRSRLLFEMMQGRELAEQWRSQPVREALDLCLACKGCKEDCPVGVDMATLKAEFMAHHYKGRLRPRAAYAMGLIWTWSRIAVHVPRLANFMLHAPLIGPLAKWVGGIAQQREMPHFAPVDFRSWFAAREVRNAGLPSVLLWPDTFNNYFYPRTLQAAVRVLEAAGYQVVLPPRRLCCGRPLYAEGMLDRARRQLADILDSLNRLIDQGVPLVGLEPSCVATFRDELPQLFPGDERARYLQTSTWLLGEFLERSGYQPPRLDRSVMVHTHCHQYASTDRDADAALLRRMQADFQMLDAGCCGMAGSFGYDAEKYEVSMRIAGQQVVPAVRGKGEHTLVMTNGFSCREQVAHTTGEHTYHLAEIIDMALQTGAPTLEVLASTGQQAASERR